MPIDVVRTYLEMRSRADLRGATPLPADARLEHAQDCSVAFFRWLYQQVGGAYHWTDRLKWTDEECRAYLADPGHSIWVLYVAGSPAGFFELDASDPGSVEISMFGLLREYHGRGLGKALLTAAVDAAWSMQSPARVWLHTCTLDDPAALPNYLARGFTRSGEKRYTVD